VDAGLRSVDSELDASGIIGWSGRRKTILRRARPDEAFSELETAPAGDRLTAQFMDYILTGDLAPGTPLHETDLVGRFGVSSTVVREFLIRFARFGLIEKQRNRHWVLRGFTCAFATELFEVREMFERHAFERFLTADPGSEAHAALLELRPLHEHIIDDIETEFLAFPRLDERFHRVWIDRMQNRFVDDFFELISLVFHYHYRWNKVDERDRNHHAALQHLRVIDAVDARNLANARAAFSEHLDHARQTLMAAVPFDGTT
jgi:DNA-binding GntR family transcriptional regulator